MKQSDTVQDLTVGILPWREQLGARSDRCTGETGIFTTFLSHHSHKEGGTQDDTQLQSETYTQIRRLTRRSYGDSR